MTFRRLALLLLGFFFLNAAFHHAYADEKSLETEPWATDEEEKGVFKDDQYPLRWKEEIPVPPAEAGCDPTAWKKGFQDGLAGQRYLFDVPVPKGSAPARFDIYSPQRPERKACQPYRSSENALQCCNAAFRKASAILAKKVMETPSSEIHDNRLRECKRSFGNGARNAGSYCAGRCYAPHLAPIRYLGCFSMGFNLMLNRCPGSTLGQTASRLLKKEIDSQAISLKRLDELGSWDKEGFMCEDPNRSNSLSGAPQTK